MTPQTKTQGRTVLSCVNRRIGKALRAQAAWKLPCCSSLITSTGTSANQMICAAIPQLSCVPVQDQVESNHSGSTLLCVLLTPSSSAILAVLQRHDQVTLANGFRHQRILYKMINRCYSCSPVALGAVVLKRVGWSAIVCKRGLQTVPAAVLLRASTTGQSWVPYYGHAAPSPSSRRALGRTGA